MKPLDPSKIIRQLFQIIPLNAVIYTETATLLSHFTRQHTTTHRIVIRNTFTAKTKSYYLTVKRLHKND